MKCYYTRNFKDALQHSVFQSTANICINVTCKKFAWLSAFCAHAKILLSHKRNLALFAMFSIVLVYFCLSDASVFSCQLHCCKIASKYSVYYCINFAKVLLNLTSFYAISYALLYLFVCMVKISMEY